MWSILGHLLATERYPRRATTSGSFARPVIQELTASEGSSPLVVSNTRGGLTLTRPSKQGMVRSAFVEVGLEEEGEYFASLFNSLWVLSSKQDWSNRCNSLSEAFTRMVDLGLTPKYLVVPLALLTEVCGREIPVEEAKKLMLVQGYVAEVNSIKVLVSSTLPSTKALLTAEPAQVGAFTRVDDCVSVLFYRADRSVVLIDELA